MVAKTGQTVTSKKVPYKGIFFTLLNRSGLSAGETQWVLGMGLLSGELFQSQVNGSPACIETASTLGRT